MLQWQAGPGVFDPNVGHRTDSAQDGDNTGHQLIWHQHHDLFAIFHLSADQDRALADHFARMRPRVADSILELLFVVVFDGGTIQQEIEGLLCRRVTAYDK